MHTSTKARLISLNARVSRKVVEFADPQDEKSNKLRNAAIAAGTVGAGYAGLSVLRGRQWQKKVTGAADNSASGLLGALRTGHQMNTVDAARFAGSVRDSGTALLEKGTNSVIKAGRSAKAGLLLTQRRAGALFRK